MSNSFLPHLGKGDVLQLGLGLPHPVGRGLQTGRLHRPSATAAAAPPRLHVGDPPPETLVSPVSGGECVVLGAERRLLAEGTFDWRVDSRAEALTNRGCSVIRSCNVVPRRSQTQVPRASRCRQRRTLQ